MGQGCEFDSRSGHIQEPANEFVVQVSSTTNRRFSLSLSLSPHFLVLSKVNKRIKIKKASSQCQLGRLANRKKPKAETAGPGHTSWDLNPAARRCTLLGCRLWGERRSSGLGYWEARGAAGGRGWLSQALITQWQVSCPPLWKAPGVPLGFGGGTGGKSEGLSLSEHGPPTSGQESLPVPVSHRFWQRGLGLLLL